MLSYCPLVCIGNKYPNGVLLSWYLEYDRVLLLLAYAKSRTDDLSQAQIKILGELVKLELRWIEDGRKTV